MKEISHPDGSSLHKTASFNTTPVGNKSPKFAYQLLNQDGRGFFVLPQNPEDAGYYTYGSPGHGQAQYAHPELITFILDIANKWSRFDQRLIGIGNISLANGIKFPPHQGHVNGLEVDVRPLRLDGKNCPITIKEPQYDGEGTGRLISLFFANEKVRRIRFNDTRIRNVLFTPGHDNHFHVDLL